MTHNLQPVIGMTCRCMTADRRGTRLLLYFLCTVIVSSLFAQLKVDKRQQNLICYSMSIMNEEGECVSWRKTFGTEPVKSSSLNTR